MTQSKWKRYAAALLLFLSMTVIYGCSAADQNMKETETEGKGIKYKAEETEKLNYPLILELPSTEDIALTAYSEGIFLVFNGKTYGFLDKAGELITDFVYEHAYPFSEGLACVKKDGKYGFINREGEVVISLIYDRANSFSEGLAYFEADGRYGFLNQKGEQAFQLDCDSISSFQEGLAYFSLDGKYGYIDQNGEKVIPPIYDDADYFSGGIARVRKGIYFGAIDTRGREVIKTVYDSVTVDRESVVVESESKFGSFDRNGMEVMPVIYDTLPVEQGKIVYKEEDNQDGMDVVRQDGKYHLADRNGAMVGSREYDEIIRDGDSYRIESNGAYGFLNAKGEEVIPPVYDFISYNEVYQSSNCCIPLKWQENARSIIITGEPGSRDLSAMLLKNEITPRIGKFHELIESGSFTVNDAESSHVVTMEKLRYEDLTMRLYCVEGGSSPVLYIHSEPYTCTNFPLSESAFFSVEDGELKELLSGYQCGGSLGGDFVHLWFDRDEEIVKIGVSGEWGGFGGYSSNHEIYSYETGVMEEEKRFWMVRQTTGNFLPQALLEHPDMYFDETGNNPYTKETIFEAEHLSEYRIDEEQTTPDRYYELLGRYRS